MFAAPFSTRGQTKTMNALADHLYQQLRDANMILIATLCATMFLGGWLSPLDGILPAKILAVPVIGTVLGNGIHWLLLKVSFVLFCFLWFRATFPRYRYDQIMRLGWKVFIPVTLVWIGVMGGFMFLTPWGFIFH